MSKVKIGVMKKGDKVLFVNANFIAIQRKNGEVDIIPIIFEADTNLPRIDNDNIMTIGYGENTMEFNKEVNDSDNEIKVITF